MLAPACWGRKATSAPQFPPLSNGVLVLVLSPPLQVSEKAWGPG